MKIWGDINLWTLMDISSTAGCTLVSRGSQRLATISSGEKSTDRKGSVTFFRRD